MFKHANFDFEYISHKFFNKQFTGSTHRYTINSKSNIDEVLKNRKVIEEDLNVKSLKIVKQIHSNIVCTVENPMQDTNEIEADALVSNISNIALGVNTADCVPVLFADNINKVIGIAHAGWKGALKNILQNTVESMEKLGAKKTNIQALIGPCIHKESYEVGQDLYDEFVKADQANKKYFDDLNISNKYLFSLKDYVKDKLKALSLNNIYDKEHNTFAMPSLYSSYRRSSLGGEVYQGSLLSTIYMK
jgi:YfiH family protein